MAIKHCPHCGTMVGGDTVRCPKCDFKFPPPKKHTFGILFLATCIAGGFVLLFLIYLLCIFAEFLLVLI